jgi:lysine 2,3-aminomutase
MCYKVITEMKNQTLEDEPPSQGDLNISGESAKTTELDDEPPGTTATTRSKLFGHVPDSDWNDWRWQFKNRITSVEELARYIPLSLKEQAELKLVTAKYPLAITPYYLSLINLDDPNDPIRKQAVPSVLEITMGILGMEDPLEERRDSVVPGLVHRYPDRALMVLTDICPMLCRHCTRKREWRKGGWVRTPEEIEAMLAYLRQNKQVRDIVISGGDPLTLSTRRLEEIISKLRQIEHLEIIRIGTRYPVVLPQRIDAELCAMLSRYGPIWLNTHFNTHREITPESAAACDRLLRAGVPVNNQCVLMRGINDTVEKHMKLCHGLLKIKVRPYYLFQCDEVQGTEHLRTPIETGIKIIEGLRGHTSGLAVPTFAVDLSHGGGKVSLQPNYLLSETEDGFLLRNYQNRVFHYRNPRGTNGLRNGRRMKQSAMPLASLFKDETLMSSAGEGKAEPVPVRVKNHRLQNKAIAIPAPSLFSEKDYQTR